MTTRVDYTAIPYDRTRESFDVTLSIPKALVIKQLGQKTVYAPLEDYPLPMLVAAIVKGLPRCLNDGIGGKDKTDADRLAYLTKKIDAQLAGSFDIIDKEAPITTEMREVYIDDEMSGDAKPTRQEVEKAMRETVKEMLGDVNATFTNFLLAIAKGIAGSDDAADVDPIFDELFAGYEDRARERQAIRAKAGAKFTIDLGKFNIKPKA